MYKFKEENMKVPCFIWSEKGSIDEGAIEQIKNASSLPFVFHHTAIMADGHVGYGAPIGGVTATRDVVIPNFVGVDIGCGMCGVKTTLEEIATDTLKKILGKIRQVVPVGFNRHRNPQVGMPSLPVTGISYDSSEILEIVTREYRKAEESLGTLGGGNHFIEIQKGSDGHIWIMLHSGSRNLGLQVAKHYNKIAVAMNKKWYSCVPKEWELAFLLLDSLEGQDYLAEMNYCVSFAFENRKLMMKRIKDVFAGELSCGFDEMINIAHNYAALENHFGKNVIVHRKGATRARENQLGIIPGSQGTSSYIVEGKGNVESFKSCSHGAGRRMGRKQAQRDLNLEAEKKMLDDLGIIHSIRGERDLDEAPSAYKDISIVMNNQVDLVDISIELKPLAVIKG